MDSRAVETSLVEFLRKELRVREDPLERDFELVESGVISSMDLARLVSYLEELADLSIPDADVIPENFGSIGRMLAYVEERSAA